MWLLRLEMWLVTKELNFSDYSVLMNLCLYVNGHMWLVATTMDSMSLENEIQTPLYSKQNF